MLKLVNSLFVAVDATIDVNADRVIISKDYAFPVAQVLDEVAHGSLYAYADNYNDLVGPGKRFASLYELINFAQITSAESGREFVFYCDKQGLADLLTNYFKALLPNASSSDIFRIINSYQTRQRLKAYCWNSRVTSKNVPELISELSVTSIDVDQAFVSSTVRPSDFTQFFRSNLAGLSIEFLLANYSVNGKNSLELTSVLKDEVTNGLINFFVDVKEDLINNVWFPSFRQALGLPAEITLDTVESVLSNSTVRIYFDKGLWMPINSTSTTVKRQRMTDILTPNTVQQLFEIYNTVMAWETTNGGSAGVANPHTPYITEFQYCVNNLGNPDWSKIISNVLNDDLWDNPFFNKWDTTVNIYLLEYIINAHRNNKSALQPYLINGSM